MLQPDPQVVVWEYTLRCNSKCLHCGSDAKLARVNELNTKESLDLVDQISGLGFNQIVLSGGEPTLRKDWYTISERVLERGLNLGIISNALHWDAKTITKISSLNAFGIGFSIDGEPELHDYLRGFLGSHKKVFDVIGQFKRKNTTVCAITSVNHKNLEELVLIRDRLIVYGVDAWQLQVSSPMGRMKQQQDLVLTQDDYYRLTEFIIESREKLPYMNVQAGDCIGYFGVLGSKVRDSVWDGCMAGIKGLGIESDGTVKGCLSLQTPLAREGNIRNRSLREIWSDLKTFKYTRGFKLSDLKGDCSGCEHGAQCRGGCQSQSQAFHNEFSHAPYCLSRYEQKFRAE